MSSRPSRARRLLDQTIRIWLPLAISIAGIVLVIAGSGGKPNELTSTSTLQGAGVGLIIVGIIVWMINWLFRMSLSSNEDREREERAREYFDVHGRWPGEDGAA